MANVRREAAPKTAAVRLRARRTGLRRAGLTATDARSAFGKLTRGGRVVCLSKGAVSLADTVAYVLATSGPADLTLATWTIGAREIATFRQLLDGGAVRSLRLLVDASFPHRNAAYAAQLRATFGPDCLRLAICHAKIATVINGRWAFVVLSSANLNRNSRLEFFQVEDNRTLATAITATLGEWFEAAAVDQWNDKPIAHRTRFDAWAEKPSLARTFGPRATVAPAADGDAGSSLDAPLRPLAPATAGDAAFFNSEPWGVDLRRVGVSYVR